jgi:hypothetical protein
LGVVLALDECFACRESDVEIRGVRRGFAVVLIVDFEGLCSECEDCGIVIEQVEVISLDRGLEGDLVIHREGWKMPDHVSTPV